METLDGVSFRFFGTDFSLTWKELSTLLGFHQCCTVDIEHATRGFHTDSFGIPSREQQRVHNHVVMTFSTLPCALCINGLQSHAFPGMLSELFVVDGGA